MEKTFIVANWKSNKTSEEVKDWFDKIAFQVKEIPNLLDKEVIICPSFVHLHLVKSLVEKYNLPFKLGAQDVSPFEQGAYTGAVNARQIKEFADYVIVGHIERRKNFLEDSETLSKKVKACLDNGIIPVYCIQDEKETIPDGVSIIAYDPLFAIGTGNPATPEDTDRIAEMLKQKNSDISVIYGGSVTSENVKSFTQMEHIDGVLPGGASLDPEKFAEIIKNA